MKWFLVLLFLLPNFAFASIAIDHTAIAWSVAENVGIDAPKFLDLIRCESGLSGFQGKPVFGDYRNGKPMAFGILQFWRGTYEKYAEQYQIDVPYEDYQAQIVLGAKMLKDGLAYKWKNCAVKTGWLPKNWSFADLST